MDVRILIVQAIAFCGVRATGIQSVTNPEGCKSQNQGVRREDRADDYGQPASDIAIMAVRSVKTILPATRPHWVGDGFNVYPTFADLAFTNEISPFLMFDYAKPKEFPRTKKKLGVGKHPHRGIVTVTLAMQGEVEHGDNVGNSGVIGTGDVQWMSAGRGIVHEEYHSRKFASTGGMFEMCQLWLNLPASHKMSKPTYQPILEAEIPVVPVIGETVDDACVHIICGEYNGTKGPANPVTPVDMWHIHINPTGKTVDIPVPTGYNSMLFVRKGSVTVGEDGVALGPQGLVLFKRDGDVVRVTTTSPETRLIVLQGEPLNEPIVNHGPMVMNTQEEIQQAFSDYYAGKFGL
eukprot:m.1205041 g.1205041  ORF g.1205041 m.1205041 type:complete len:349 (-) comp24582_c0_seq10:4487-5533(-)